MAHKIDQLKKVIRDKMKLVESERKDIINYVNHLYQEAKVAADSTLNVEGDAFFEKRCETNSIIENSQEHLITLSSKIPVWSANRIKEECLEEPQEEKPFRSLQALGVDEKVLNDIVAQYSAYSLTQCNTSTVSDHPANVLEGRTVPAEDNPTIELETDPESTDSSYDRAIPTVSTLIDPKYSNCDTDQENHSENAAAQTLNQHSRSSASRSSSRSARRSRSPLRERRSRSVSRNNDRRRSRSGSASRSSKHKSPCHKAKRRLRKEQRKDHEKERRRKGLPRIRENFVTVCSTTLWVGHLLRIVNSEDLADAFSSYGDIASIDLIIPRRCAFIRMNRRQDAYNALNKLNDHPLYGKPINVAWAPGRGTKGRDWKDYFELDVGATFIPWSKITPNIDLTKLDDGGMIDEETVPPWFSDLKDFQANRIVENRMRAAQLSTIPPPLIGSQQQMIYQQQLQPPPVTQQPSRPLPLTEPAGFNPANIHHSGPPPPIPDSTQGRSVLPANLVPSYVQPSSTEPGWFA